MRAPATNNIVRAVVTRTMAAPKSFLVASHEIAGQVNDEAQPRRLGHLQVEDAETNPAPGAVYLVADAGKQHEKQQAETGQQHERPDTAPELQGNEQAHHAASAADYRRQQLPLDIVKWITDQVVRY
jgi:hypothetical protein